MIIRSTRFGDITLSEDQLITFESGIFGFENHHKYVLLQLDEKDSTFQALQSVDDEDLAFVITEPFLFKQDYEFELPTAIKNQLGIEREEDAQIFSIITIRSQNDITINLKAPIILNKALNKAVQIVLESVVYSIRHPLTKGGA
ncbi:flagellar assembly protein FliW [Paenibacillus lutrae]|uniref:Flagellar assembly factor FliW n=1 Tax=Paenibacillus lutrae TaxID=2078573 RepID=A0A7X3FL00_9BACL|nr:flagellar assembly protein FliW [Paenibacillus lutrae]MVP01548.1 flagellar assembly protein FliW [Paenibacillus lutrae]